MLFACWIPKATNTHSEYVIFSLQRWLHERAFVLRHTYIGYRVKYWICFAMCSCRKSLRNKFGLQMRIVVCFSIYVVTDDFVLDKLIPWLGPLYGLGFIFTDNADICLACRILWKGRSVVLHFQFLFTVRPRRPYLQTQKSVRKKIKQDLATFTVTALTQWSVH